MGSGHKDYITKQMYDLIGDIHGHADELEALLVRLGYSRVGDSYRHDSRQAIFIGDFIDRGPHQRRVVELVRSMIESAAARAVMGNHEYNAIAYYTPRTGGGYLRERSLNVTPSCLQAWRYRGDGLPFIKISGRCIRYRWNDLQEWIDDHRCSSTSQY